MIYGFFDRYNIAGGQFKGPRIWRQIADSRYYCSSTPTGHSASLQCQNFR